MKTALYLKGIDILKGIFSALYQVPLLVYHSIGGNDSGAMPLAMFRKQMDFLRMNNFEVISLYEAIGLVRDRKKVRQRAVSITFDDGYEDSFRVVYPILKEYGFPATLFVCVNKVGHEGYVGFNELRVLVSEGLITIGSHTLNHSDLLRLDSEGIAYEINTAKRVLEDNLKCTIDLFAYPWGLFSPLVQAVVEKEGFQAAVSTNLKINNSLRTDDIYALRRMTMDSRDSFLHFLVKISGFGTCFARRLDYERGVIHGFPRRIGAPC